MKIERLLTPKICIMISRCCVADWNCIWSCFSHCWSCDQLRVFELWLFMSKWSGFSCILAQQSFFTVVLHPLLYSCTYKTFWSCFIMKVFLPFKGALHLYHQIVTQLFYFLRYCWSDNCILQITVQVFYRQQRLGFATAFKRSLSIHMYWKP